MKNFISFLIFLLFAWLAMWWYYSCDWCTTNNNQNPSVVNNEKVNSDAEALTKKAYEDSIKVANLESSTYSIKDDKDQDVLTFTNRLQTNNQDGKVFIPSTYNGFEEQIADYLGNNQDEELIIDGFETPKEKNAGTNLGFSRANYIKNLLVNAGINGDRILTEGKEKEYSYEYNGKYYDGISLTFNTLSESRLAEVEKSVANRTLYSNFGEKTFKADATLSNYALELKNYLNKYPNKSVQIVGHTDDIGSAEANLWYGKERAKNVKNYLISQGIASSKLKALSKGESNPIVPNTNDENRAQNRRIEIIVN
ncbi:OmpA family protein [Aquimarina sp. D1M17]|uniref:OmpA family protein n=1 Tax=Aquimarina acroporae TaxID=2937283 RepID=UPI0020C0EDC5|nr:OmpA family protein [Aquimarina acroporae]MCK8520337.1 OmpA family protein [Aquimarina acroporae]